jgi:hypothetical protein
LALHFFDYSLRVHHLINRDDRHLLAHAMASDFSVAWQCLSKRTIGFLLRIKLHARTRVFLSSGRCNVHCATPPERGLLIMRIANKQKHNFFLD